MIYLFLIIGFVLLIKGAEAFVDGSSSIALIFKVPPLIIGLTIVAMGTSSPEAAVSVVAAIQGNNAIAVSNVIGSNMFNILIVAGLCAVIKPVSISTEIIRRDYPINLLATIVILLLSVIGGLILGRLDGIIILLLFSLFIYFMIQAAQKHKHDTLEIEITNKKASKKTIKLLSPLQSVFLIIVGLVAIIIGGDLVVDSASAIATSFGLSQHLIGLTIVAIGTSLPELVTSIVAGIKGKNELAIGNVIGSNIFNLLLILGLSSTLKPISIDMVSIYDMLILFACSLLVYVYVVCSKRIGRFAGILMTAAYIGYMAYIVIR